MKQQNDDDICPHLYVFAGFHFDNADRHLNQVWVMLGIDQYSVYIFFENQPVPGSFGNAFRKLPLDTKHTKVQHVTRKNLFLGKPVYFATPITRHFLLDERGSL